MSFLDYFGAAWDVATKAKSVETQSALMRMREEYNTSREEVLALKSRVSELEEELRKAKGGVEFRRPWYYTKSPEGVEDGPFCAHCYETKNKLLIHAREYDDEYSGFGHMCPACNYNHQTRPATRDINDDLRNQIGRRDYTNY